MVATRFSEGLRSLDFYFLVAKHIDRMSEQLKEGLQAGGSPNAEKLIGYYLQTKHYENMITMFLPEYYWKAKKRVFPTIPPISWTWGDVISNLRFFNSVSKWFQLVHTTAFNEGLLKIAKPYKKDEWGVRKVDGSTINNAKDNKGTQ